jgi:hypothetical protein
MARSPVAGLAAIRFVIISRRGIVRGERGKRGDAAAGRDIEVRDAVGMLKVC